MPVLLHHFLPEHNRHYEIPRSTHAFEKEGKALTWGRKIKKRGKKRQTRLEGILTCKTSSPVYPTTGVACFGLPVVSYLLRMRLQSSEGEGLRSVGYNSASELGRFSKWINTDMWKVSVFTHSSCPSLFSLWAFGPLFWVRTEVSRKT